MFFKNTLSERWQRYLLTIFILVGAYLRLAGLHGTRFIFADEYRALVPNLIPTPVFAAVMQIPIMLFGASHDLVMICNGLLGTLQILVVYLVARELFGRDVALASAGVLSVLGMHIVYSRLGYPVVLQSLFILLGFWKLLSSSVKDHCISALLFALAFLCHGASYAAIGAAVGVYGCIHLSAGRSLSSSALKMILFGGTVTVLSLSIIFLCWLISPLNIGFVDALGKFSEFAQVTRLYTVESTVLGRAAALITTAFHFFISSSGWAGIALLALLIPACVQFHSSFQGRVLLGFTVITATLFSLAFVFDFNSFYPRHLVMLLPFLAILASGGLCTLVKRAHSLVSTSLYALLLLALFFPASKVFNRTFKISPILEEIAQRGIQIEQVASRIDLDGYDKTHVLPTYYKGGYPLGAIKIDWAQVQNEISKGRYRYILTAGLGSAAPLGKDEPNLEGCGKLLQSWPHPYSDPLYSGYDHTEIGLYDLVAISPEDVSNSTVPPIGRNVDGHLCPKS